MIKFSTIIPIYNKETALRQTLQSVVNNHEVPDAEYECILVDDESTDSCPEICKEFCTKYPYFKYVKIFNNHIKTPTDARNIGLKLSEGEYIHFLDADDILRANFYNEGINILASSKTNIFIRGHYIVEDNIWQSFYPNLFKRHIIGPPLQGCIFKREAIHSLKFEYVVSEDIVFSGLALMSENYKYYDDSDNPNSVDSMRKYSDVSRQYKNIFGCDPDDTTNVVMFMQKYENYPYKVVNGQIVKKFDETKIKQ